jgi:hypothetical protein
MANPICQSFLNSIRKVVAHRINNTL